MKILILSPYDVSPPLFGGQVRVCNIAKELSNLGNDVTIACSYTGFKEKGNFRMGRVKIIYFRTYIQDVLVFMNKFISIPLIISYHLHKYLGIFYRKLFVGYDLIQFEQPFLACWMTYVPKNIIKVYSSQNVELDFDLINFKDSILYYFYKNILIDCERTALVKSDIVLAVSNEDKHRLAALYKVDENKISIVENGFDPEISIRKDNNLKKQLGINYGRKIAVFVGSFTPPNIKAVKLITQKIAPKNPEINFLLMGDSANSYSGKSKNIIKIGKVKNLDDYLAISDIGLLPVKEGSGTNLKLLSYLKFKLQVLSTDFGLRGYNDLKKYVNLADYDDFPIKIRQVFKKRISKSILRKYTWRNLVLKLDRIYKVFEKYHNDR